jgi:hypothetical protein
MLSQLQAAIALYYINQMSKVQIVPDYPSRNEPRYKYNRDNPENELKNDYFLTVGRGDNGKWCRNDHESLVKSLTETLFDPNLLFNIISLSGETDMSCLFYVFMTLRMYLLARGVRPIFVRTKKDSLTYTTNHRLGMVGMMDFLCDKIVTSQQNSEHQKYKTLLLSILRKKLGKSTSNNLLGHLAGRMRWGHTFNHLIQGKMYRIETFRFNFNPGMNIIMYHQKKLFLAKTFKMYASILSSIPDENKSGVSLFECVSFQFKQSPPLLKFLESLHFILFNLRVEKTIIYEYFMREYYRIILEFTVSSTEDRVKIALLNLFGYTLVHPKDSIYFSQIISFMKTYSFCSSELYFFQKEVERMIVSSGEIDLLDKFLTKMKEKNAFWNILMFVIFSHNEWAKKHSQPCLSVEVFEKMF